MKKLPVLLAALAFTLFVVPLGRADEAATAAMLRAENLGELRLEMPGKDVIKLLGEPAKRGEIVLQEADGNYVQDWHYPAKGIEISMSSGGKKTGAQTVASFSAAAPCTFATKAGIKIGSAESAVRKAYAAHADRESPADEGGFIAGSIYGGIIFDFEGGKVSRIFFGAGAE
jgi:hypothetical protein